MTGTTPVRIDIAVIGAGVVGCAVSRALALCGQRVVLLERGRDILSGASKGNSALLHSGFDAPQDSLELALMRDGRERYLAVHERLGLPLLETGALLVAWNDDEHARLPALLARAHANGVGDVRVLERDELRRRMPGLAAGARGALLVPGEHVIDPWSAPLAYVLQAMAHGAEVRRNCEVRGAVADSDGARLETSRGTVHARLVVNCAGLYGDLVHAFVAQPPFLIRPRKGQFLVLDKSARALLDTIVLPVPTERSKGVLLAPTVFGNVLVGPTAEDQDDREDSATDAAVLAGLLRRARGMLPALAGHGVTAAYAGLRPATQFKDYVLERVPALPWITVGGIRSTGLTAALGIAERVRCLAEDVLGPLRETATPVWTPVPSLAEHLPRPYLEGGSGEIVCHCEWVTRGEIEAALTGPLPAGDLGGLKRRTRCMMGRCQGFYCASRIAEIAAQRIHWPLPAETVA